MENTFTVKNNKKMQDENKPEKKMKQLEKPEKPEINYTNYAKNTIVLKTYKIPQLKAAAKNHSLLITGNKSVIINRLVLHFLKVKSSITLQRTFRGFIVRFSVKIRGPVEKNRKLCVNDTDFVTMEPLDEIPRECFFSYQDEKNFTYGFNISSLIQIIKKTLVDNGTIVNPYNREKIPSKIISNIITLYRLTYIIYPEFRKENDTFVQRHSIRRYNTVARNSTVNNPPTTPPPPVETPGQPTPEEIMPDPYRPRVITNYTTSQDNYNRYNKIQELRTRPIQQRMNALFVEIDQLGNYTNSEWFSSLDLRSYHRLYMCIYEIWNYRVGLTADMKRKICPFHGPFDGIFIRPPRLNDLSLEQIKTACLIVMENMIYSGIDQDCRKIGCLHVLTGLTVVSAPARTAMPWLYDSIVY